MGDINTTQLRDALAWATGNGEPTGGPSENPFIWFWEAIEGDFNEDRTTAQILVDAGISMIPLVDQVCDIRDLIANCRKLNKDIGDGWAWVALGLTLIGLFSSLGSLVKGALKIFFGFVRRSGGSNISMAVELAMTWLIAWLRQREVQKYLRRMKIDSVFEYLSTSIKGVQKRISTKTLMAAFDRGVIAVEALVNKVGYVPVLGKKQSKY